MRTISIGDLHGHTIWKTINPSLYEKIIFLGDYVDSFDISDDQILNNLLDILEFKKSYPNKVILLLGNHDLQYLFNYDQYGCSGYRPQMYSQLYDIYNGNKKSFQMSYQIDDTIWTHAGIHQTWYDQRFSIFARDYPDLTLSEQLNLAFSKFNYYSLNDVGHRRGGHSNVGGPFWCDREELSNNPLKGYNQIVGHNRVKFLTKIYKHNKEIVFIDTLENDNPKFFEKNFK